MPANVAAEREKVISHTVKKERGTKRAPIIAHPYFKNNQKKKKKKICEIMREFYNQRKHTARIPM